MNAQTNVFRWAIAGTGRIAADFASQVSRIHRARLHSVYSRNRDNAERFRAAFRMPRASDSLAELLADPQVDAIYLALPASLHRDAALQAIEAGKPVLCEKPFALDASEAQAVVDRARERHVFCMEAMWLRFSPLVARVAEMVRGGELGEVRAIQVQAGYPADPSRLADGEPGRGALLNFGVYAVSLAQWLLGEPDSVEGDFIRAGNGLDVVAGIRLKYASALVSITASNCVSLDNQATIAGTAGRIRIGAPFFNPGWATRVKLPAPRESPAARAPVNRLPATDALPWIGLAQGAFWPALVRGRGRWIVRRPGENGLRLEAEEVIRCVREGSLESERMPHADTLVVARILDQARASATR